MRAHEFIIESIDNYDVSYIDTTEKVSQTLRMFVEVFSDVGLDVEYELRNVDWNSSVGIFADNVCYGCLAMTPLTLPQYLRSKPDINIEKELGTDYLSLRSIQGDAFYIDSSVPPQFKTRMLLRLLKLYSDYDYFWGLAHTSLNNMGFWRKHSIPIGIHSEENAWLFVIPLNSRAIKIFSDIRPQT
jgi:hypothetical protein